MKKGRYLENLKKSVNFDSGTSSYLRDYHNYLWRKSEFVTAILISAAVVAGLSYFFYRSVFAAIPLSAVGAMFFVNMSNDKAKKSREELVAQFKECIISVQNSMRAGYAVENAFLESREDMRMLYGEDSYICRELETIRRGLVVNKSLEELLSDLAKRSDSDEIYQFAQVFAIGKRSGGGLPEIIRTSAELIAGKIDTKAEIRTVLSGRRFEQNIMKIMPFGILMYIGVSYPGYFDGLYHNVQGVIIMSVCLAVYLAAYIMGDRIMDNIEKEMM